MFRTEIADFTTKIRVNHETTMLSMGSCFALDVGQRLHDHKFKVVINPGGILFNPLSIFELLTTAIDDDDFPEASFLQTEGRFLNYKLHSSVGAGSLEQMQFLLSSLKKQCRKAVLESDLIIFTFGTAWVYRLVTNDMLVANCHKVPQSHFHKALLSVDDIVTSFSRLRQKILELKANVHFMLTVSPVRHIKDTIPLNSVSKSALRLACHRLEQENGNVTYFPSYEIMMDDLRDYRFYEKDMIHPNEQAVDYIWSRFAETCFDTGTQRLAKEWSSIQAALAHKPFHPHSEAHQKFLQRTLQRVENLAGKVDVSEEVAFLRSQMTKS